jgi:hypothetical protein
MRVRADESGKDEAKDSPFSPVRVAHLDSPLAQLSPDSAMIHVEPCAYLGERQPRFVELSSLSDLVVGEALAADGDAGFTEQPDHTALAESI